MERRSVGPVGVVVVMVLVLAWGAAHVALWGPYGLFLLPFEFVLVVFSMILITIARNTCCRPGDGD